MITIYDFERLYTENQYTEAIIDHQTGAKFEWLYEDNGGRIYGDSEDAAQGLIYLPNHFAGLNTAAESKIMGFSETQGAITLMVESIPLEFLRLEYEDEYTRIYYHRGKRWAAWNGDTYIRFIKQDMSLPELIEYLKD